MTFSYQKKIYQIIVVDFPFGTLRGIDYQSQIADRTSPGFRVRTDGAF